jgi:hypothetical protein
MITQPQIPEELFHYCPTNSFHGIISSKQLWLSNLEYSNDPNENQIAFQVLDSISRDHANQALKNYAKKIINTNNPVMDYPSSCVFCMSQQPDDLIQWREYADNGFGYIIGISTKYFLSRGVWEFFNPHITSPLNDQIFLSRCIYKPEEQRSIIEKLLNDFLQDESNNMTLGVDMLKYVIKLFSSIFKHHSYTSEKEWRIICFPAEPAMHGIHNSKYKVLFRSRRQGIVRYVEQNLTDGKSSDIPLSSITIGPNIFNKIIDIITYLRNNGYPDVLTIESKIKMRDVK